jgi:hypothetical protein
MNIVEQAEADLSFTLEDKTSGFGVAIVLINKSNVRYGEADELIIQSTDIGFRMDPQTGALIVNRTAEINLRLSTLLTVTTNVLPEKGWKIEITNAQSDNIKWTYALREAIIDRKLGIFKMTLALVDTT